MIRMYDNPIFKRLIQPAPTGNRHRVDPAVVMAGALALLAVAGVLLVIGFGYERTLITALALTLGLGMLFLAVIVIAVIIIILHREISTESYDLLFLTNIPIRRVVWGTVLGVAWRLRAWGVAYVWMVTAGGTAISTWFFDRTRPESGYRLASLSFPFAVPPLSVTVAYGLVWAAIGLCSLVSLFGGVTAAGFQRPINLERLVSIVLRVLGANVLLLATVLVAVTIARTDLPRATLAALLWVLLLGLIGTMTARRWGFSPVVMGYAYSRSLPTYLLAVVGGLVLFPVGALILGYIIDAVPFALLILIGLAWGVVRFGYYRGLIRRNKGTFYGLVYLLNARSQTLLAASAVAAYPLWQWPAFVASWIVVIGGLGFIGLALSGIHEAWPLVWPTDYAHVLSMWFSEYNTAPIPQPPYEELPYYAATSAPPDFQTSASQQ